MKNLKNQLYQNTSNRLGKLEDIANAVIFLISDQANYINGETIHINGGLYLG